MIMKTNIFFLVVAFLFVSLQIKSQSIANYSVTRSTGNTYNSIQSVGIPFGSWRNNGTYIEDDNRSYQHDIGFDFWYNGVRYTAFCVGTNGYIDFSTSTANGTGTGAYGYQNTQFSATGGSLIALAPFYDDQTTQGATDPLGESISYYLSGTEPNRVLTVEWRNMAIYGNTTPNLNYQLKIYEKTGVIEYNYGSMINGTTTFSYSLGLNGTVNTQLRTQQTANTTTFSTTAQNALTTIPESNSTLTFTPPTPTVVSGSLTFGAVTSSSIVLNWTNWASNEVGYVIYYSTDNVNFNFLIQKAANSVTHTASSLLPGTTYYFKIMAVTEGGVSDALTGSQTTSAPTTITSAQTGNWGTGSTWVGGIVPSSTNNVIIKNGHTVSIAANASCYNLTIGEGTSGVLEYIGNTARTLTLTGDLMINSGATFTVNAGSNRTHLFSTSGNIVNNGTLNFYTDAASICNSTFNKNGNQTISGTGAITKFNLITLNMGTSKNNILEVSSSTFSSGATANYLTLSNGTFKYSVTGATTITPYTTAYTISATAGLWMNSLNSTVNIGASLTLNGDLMVSAGTLNVGDAANENLISGGGQITVNGGILNIAGRLDRTFATTITKLTISNGTINVPVIGSTSTTISPLEMSVEGSIFEMSGGTIVIPQSGSNNLGINMTNGILNITGGTLQIGSTSTPVGANILINSLVSFANFNINSTNVTATLSGDFTVFNNFTIESGVFNANNFNTNVGGNWTNNGIFTPGTGVFTFNGSGNQIVSKVAGETFYNLKINKSSGEVVLSNDVIVSNILDLTLGNINSGINTITLGTSTSSAGTLNFTAGNIIGKFKRWINTSSTPILFPIGTGTNDRTTKITFNNLTNGSLTTNFVSTNPNNNGLPLVDNGGFIVQNQFSEGYWDLIAADGLISTDYNIEFNGEGFTSYPLASSNRIVQRNDVTSAWTLSGVHVDASLNYAKRNSSSGLSAQFGFGKTVCSVFAATSITGNTSVCANDANLTYSVANTIGNIYNWTVTGGTINSGQGTNSINVTWGATGGDWQVKVIEQNNCGDNNTAVTLPIIVHPYTISAINGATSVAQNQTGVVYFVNNLVGYSYSWLVTGGTIASGNGTNSITVDWAAGTSGNVQVTVTPTCGSNQIKNLAITIRGEIISANSGNWNTASTWVGGVVPTNLDFVTISTGHTVLMDVNPASCYKLTINGTANWTSSFTTNVGVGGLTISSTGNITGSVAGIITSAGGLVLNSVLTSNTVSIVLQTTASKLISGTGSLAKLTINANSINVGNITVRSLLDGSATLTQGANSKLTLNMPSISISGLMATGAGNTVIYESNFAQSVKNLSYKNLTLLGAGTKTLIGLTSISNNLTLTDATLDISANNYSISIGGNFISTNSTFNSRFGNVTFNGTIGQTITGETNFYNLTINNTSSGLTLNNNITISGLLTFTTGKINTGTNQVIVLNTNNSSIAGFSNSKFINGNLTRYIATNTNTYSFPVGNGNASSNYYRIDFINNNISGVSYLTASVNNIIETANNVDSRLNTTQETITAQDVKGEFALWNLVPNTNPVSGSYGLNLYIENISGLLDNEFFTVCRNNSSTDYLDWNTLDATTTVPSLNMNGRTLASGYANRLGLASFYQYSVGHFRKLTTQFDLVSSSNSESIGANQIQVSLNDVNNKISTVDYTLGGTATNGVDYTLSAGTITFPIGTLSQSIPFNITNDIEIESSETITLTLTNPSAGITLGTNSLHTFTILDDEGNRHIDFNVDSIYAVENQNKSDYWDWVKQIGGTGKIYPRSMVIDSQNNVILLSKFDGVVTVGGETFTTYGGNDILLSKFSSAGVYIWGKQSGSNDNDDPMSLALDLDENIYISGGFKNTINASSKSAISVGGQDVFLTKYSSTGNVLWIKNIAGGTGVDRAEGMTINNQEIILVGIFNSTANFGGTNLTAEYSTLNNFVAKYDTSGTFVWVKQIKGNNVGTRINTVKAFGNKYYIAGSFLGTVYIDSNPFTSLGLKDLIISKFDSLGNSIWVKTGGGVKDDYWSGIDVDSNGSIYLTGTMCGNGSVEGQSITVSGASDFVFAKYDSFGNLNFAKNNGGLGVDVGFGIHVKNNSVHVAGLFSGEMIWGETTLKSSGIANNDAFLGILDNLGNYILAKHIKGGTYEQGSLVKITDDGNAFMSGYFNSDSLYFGKSSLLNTGDLDGFIAKYKYASVIPVYVDNIDNVNATTVDYSVIGGTALGNGVDYTLSNGTLTVDAGKDIGYISLMLSDDLLEETLENIQISLSNPTNSVLGVASNLIYSIIDNDQKPSIEFNSVEDYQYESVGQCSIKVNLSHTYVFDATVDFSITGTATNGVDYNLANGTLTIKADSTNAYITIPIISDELIESSETIILTLSNAVNSTIGTQNVFTLTLSDLPNVPTVSNGCKNGAGVVELSATSSTGLCTWYDASVGGNLLAAGLTYTTSLLSTTTNYYVASARTDASLDFSGSNNSVIIPNSSALDLEGTITIEMKIKSSDWSTRQYLLDKLYNGEGRLNIEAGGNPNFFYGNGSSYSSGAAYQNIPENEWTHIAIVRDSSKSSVSWYINGVFAKKYTSTYFGTKTTNDIIIGTSFDGELDEIRIWNTARTSNDILVNKDKILFGNESGLVAYYNMNNGHGAIMEDLTANNLDGMLINMDSTTVWKQNTIITESPRVLVQAIISNNPVELGADTTILGNIVLDATNQYSSYLWSNASTQQTLNVTQTGTYWVSVVDASGCFDTDTINITINLQNLNPPIVDNDTIIGSGSTVLKSSSSTNVCTWYDQAVNGTLLSKSKNYTTPILNTTTNYYVSTANMESSLDFSGSNDYVRIPNSASLDMDGTLTIEMKIKSSTWATRQYPFDKFYNGEGRFSVEAGGNPNFFYGNGTNYSSGAAYQNIPTNQWAHIAVVRDNSKSTLSWYIDGVFIRKYNTTYTGTITANDLIIGGTFNGELDEIRIWNTARTASELLVNKDRILNGNESGLVAYYNMNNGHGLVLEDLTANNLDGILVNMDSTQVWKYNTIIAESSRTMAQVVVNSAKSISVNNSTDNFSEISKQQYTFNKFEAKQNGDIIDLKWLMENEINTYYYTIEKSLDSRTFEVVDVIFAGDNASLVDYYIFDDKPTDGITYYRLKQTDLSGKSIYSDLIQVEYGKEHKQIIFKIYPNPVQQTENFYVNMTGLESNKKVMVQVVDAMGRERYSKVIFTNSDGEVLEAMDPDGRLEPGTYFIVGSSNNMLESKKLIIK